MQTPCQTAGKEIHILSTFSKAHENFCNYLMKFVESCLYVGIFTIIYVCYAEYI